MEGSSSMFELLNNDKKTLPAPSGDEIVIGAALHEMYGVDTGDTVVVSFPGFEAPLAREMIVAGIAFNAAADSIYMEKKTLAAILSLPTDSYTGDVYKRQLWGFLLPISSSMGVRAVGE